MLIPLFGSFSGSVAVLPGNLKLGEIAILIAFGTTVSLAAMKFIPRLPRWNGYDGLLFLNLIYLATVFARNPVGVLMFQSDIIGGRPYFEIAIALLAYLALQHVTLTAKQATIIPILAGFGVVANTCLSAATVFFPSLAEILFPIYSGVVISGQNESIELKNDSDTRQAYLAGYGNTVGSIAVSFWNPLRLFFFTNTLSSLTYFSAVVAILLSGFRSSLTALIVLTALSVYFRNGLGAVARLAVIGLTSLVLIIGCQSIGFKLPLPAQRALSFLPGEWDARATSDAQGSSEWRFEMWRVALSDDRYIRDKLLGDGFGFRVEDIQGFQSMGGMEGTTPEQVQDYFLTTGIYHSGPISSIRFVGAIGLVLITVFMIVLARYAWKLVGRSKETPFFVVALFVCSPAIYAPFGYWFIFGTADLAYAGGALTLGFLNVLDRSLNAYEMKHLPRQGSLS